MKKKRYKANLPITPRFEEIAQILCHCEQLKCDIMSYNGEHARSYREVFSPDLLGRANAYFYQLFILKLYMVLYQTQDYYFKRVAEDILNDPNTKWVEAKSKGEVEKVLTRLSELEDEILPALQTLRDKFIAHRDFYRDLENAAIGYNQAWRVLLNLQQLYNIVNYHAFNTTMRFDALSSSEAGEYRHLSRFAKIWQKLRPEWTNPRDKFTRDLIYLAWGRTPPDAAD